MMDQYDEGIAAMEASLDRLSRLVGVLPDGSPERADVQDQGLLLYRELEEARETLVRRRQLDAAIAVREARARRHRDAATQRSGDWARAAGWTLVPGVLAVLVSLPTESWQLRVVGFVLVIVGVLCLRRMSTLQRQASSGGDTGLADLYAQHNRLDSQRDRIRSTGQSPSASRPAWAPERSPTDSQEDTLELTLARSP